MTDPTIILTNTEATSSMISAALGPANTLASVSLTGMIIGGVVFLLLVGCLCSLFSRSKSKHYRELITDLYVAGTVKKFAKEDGLNLDDEYKEFKKWDRKSKLSEKDLDGAIESNLKEKVTEKVEKEIDTMNKSSK